MSILRALLWRRRLQRANCLSIGISLPHPARTNPVPGPFILGIPRLSHSTIGTAGQRLSSFRHEWNQVYNGQSLARLDDFVKDSGASGENCIESRLPFLSNR